MPAPMSEGHLKFRKRSVTTLGPGLTSRESEVLDAWYEIAVNESWTACFRLTIQHGRPVVSELRVIPTEDRNDPGVNLQPGEWSAEWLGPDAQVPDGGLTGTLLRKVPFAALSAVPDVVAWIRTHYPEDWTWLSGSAFSDDDLSRSHPGPRGPTDEELVEHAVEYLELVGKGVHNPHTILARRHEALTPDHSRHLINTAIRRGLKSSPVPLGGRGGRPGGSLLPKGEEVLRRGKKSRKEGTE